MEINNQNPIQTPPENPLPVDQGNKFISFLKENKWAIYIITASLLAIAIAAFFAFRKPSDEGAVQPKIDISVEAPQKISSGSEIIYKLHIQNNDSAPIKNISIDMTYPTGFVFVDASPKPTKLNGTQFSLPTMEKGQDTNIMIKGTLQGNAGENKTISAVMHYRYSTVTSDYIARAEAVTQITTADVTLQFDGPVNINANQDTTYVLNYANYTSKTISDFKVTVTTPKDFIISAKDPQPSFGSTWNLGQLSPNASGKITFAGNFKDAKAGDQQIFTAQAEGSVDGKPSYVLSAGQFTVTIATSALQADITLDSTGSNNSVVGVVKPGDNLVYKLTYRNNGSDPAKGVIVTATLNGEALKYDSISAAGANIQNNVITWDASGVNDLESVGAGEGGELTFSVPVNDPATRGASKNLTVSVRPGIRSSDFSQPFLGKENIAKVQTEVEITKAVSYTTGAIPPTVDQATTYFVVISVKNQTNDITGSKMTFNLPSAVGFSTSSINAEEKANVAYDANTKKITWTPGRIAAHAGSFVPQRKLSFSITINPGVTLRNQPVTLVNNIKFNAVDDFTSQPIAITEDPISTNDEASGEGVVR